MIKPQIKSILQTQPAIYRILLRSALVTLNFITIAILSRTGPRPAKKDFFGQQPSQGGWLGMRMMIKMKIEIQMGVEMEMAAALATDRTANSERRASSIANFHVSP